MFSSQHFVAVVLIDPHRVWKYLSNATLCKSLLGVRGGKDEPDPAPAVPESSLSLGRFRKEVNVGRGEMKGGLEQSGGLLQAAAELKCVS